MLLAGEPGGQGCAGLTEALPPGFPTGWLNGMVEKHEVQLQRVERVGFGAQELDATLDGTVHHFVIAIAPEGDVWMGALDGIDRDGSPHWTTRARSKRRAKASSRPCRVPHRRCREFGIPLQVTTLVRKVCSSRNGPPDQVLSTPAAGTLRKSRSPTGSLAEHLDLEGIPLAGMVSADFDLRSEITIICTSLAVAQRAAPYKPTHCDPTDQTPKVVECGSADHRSENERPSFHSRREGFVDGAVDGMHL